ncbi:calcium-binding protein, partial [Cognatishimia sp. F0-27]|uniref:calcium-binding protein n=1 Tax=Cognatishimia sp. F0-27 TaxID=2816855 RepID=UPI001DD875E2|nr:hypothetical protein [Cognatishimia sp. F0-27]
LNDGLQFDGIEELIYYGGTGADRVEVVLYDEDVFNGEIRGGAGSAIDVLRLDLSAFTEDIQRVNGQIVGENNATAALSYSGFERAEVIGGSGNDILALTSPVAISENDAFVDGGSGNDSITTGFGNDTLIGGDGDDTLAAGEGVDS